MLGRFVRFLVVLIVLTGAVAYVAGYWQPTWLPPSPALAGNRTIDADAARQKAGEAGRRLGDEASKAATKLGEVVGDGSLTAKIKSKMALDDTVDATAIRVDTTDGVVTLSGTVASARERERALMLARETSGVKRVEDKLALR